MSYNGIIVIDKPQGIGSTDCVRIVRKTLNQKKIGHSGTLDFLATGVLVICLGKATKIIEYLQKQKKTYVAELQFGIETDTLDIEGEVLKTTDKKVSLEDFRQGILKFQGEIQQVPPMYSALKHEGKRLYDLARAGIEVERKSRKVSIYKLEIMDFNYENQTATIKATVSAGTYIRSLIDDLGKSVNNYAHMTSLIRSESCGFKISDAINIENIEKEDLVKSILPIELALNNFEKVYVNPSQKTMLLNGMTVQFESTFKDEEILVFDKESKMLGIGHAFNTSKGNMLKLRKHLNINENN